MVAALQALQVKLGVLQLRRHFLALLLQLLHRALHILIICLQISQLQHAYTNRHKHMKTKTHTCFGIHLDDSSMHYN